MRQFSNHKLPKLNQDKIDNLNNFVTIKKIEFVIKKFSKNKSLAQIISLENSIKYLQKNKPILYNFF